MSARTRDRPGAGTSRVRAQGYVVAVLAIVVSAVGGCGYHAVYANEASGEGAKLHVKLVRSLVPDAVAADEVVSGLRDELAQSGALAAGEGYPRVEVEVLRLDESSEGIAAPRGASGPVARGTQVAVVARAWIASAADAPVVHDTGDMRVLDAIAVGQSAVSDSFQHADATRAAARRMGHKLALKVLGHPANSEE